MSSSNLDAADLAGVSSGGLIREDVMEAIWDISNVPLPFTDRIGSDPVSNSYAEWTTDSLASPDVTNATIDGADAGADQSSSGSRVGNHCQIPDKVVKVSQRAQDSRTIGFDNSLAYQVMRRQQELRRDVEAIMLFPQASVADDGSATAGKLGGLPSWLTSNTDRGATGADGGFSAGTVSAPTFGTIRALSLATFQDTVASVWEGGGNPTVAMSVPAVIKELSRYMFDNNAPIATLQRNASGMGQAEAIASVNVMVTDYGVTIEFVPNRLQQKYNSDTAADLLIIDPEYVMQGFLSGYRVLELAKNGPADNRQMLVDVTLKVLNEAAHGVVADIDPTAAVVA